MKEYQIEIQYFSITTHPQHRKHENEYTRASTHKTHSNIQIKFEHTKISTLLHEQPKHENEEQIVFLNQYECSDANRNIKPMTKTDIKSYQLRCTVKLTDWCKKKTKETEEKKKKKKQNNN